MTTHVHLFEKQLGEIIHYVNCVTIARLQAPPWPHTRLEDEKIIAKSCQRRLN